MTGLQGNDQVVQQLGEAWIGALVEKDFQRLAGICHPEVRSRLMTPKRIDALESASALTQKVEGWFGKCDAMQTEQFRVAQVGGKLAIFYRLRFEKNGEPYTAEQQLYCSLRDGRIDGLDLLCSGFQPVQARLEASIPQAENSAPTGQLPAAKSSLRADALLKMDTGGGRDSTCALLTPSIKHKLNELSSGQVLEVYVDDPTAKEDIEAWCRLSGNSLLSLERGAGQGLHFYLMKK